MYKYTILFYLLLGYVNSLSLQGAVDLKISKKDLIHNRTEYTVTPLVQKPWPSKRREIDFWRTWLSRNKRTADILRQNQLSKTYTYPQSTRDDRISGSAVDGSMWFYNKVKRSDIPNIKFPGEPLNVRSNETEKSSVVDRLKKMKDADANDIENESKPQIDTAQPSEVLPDTITKTNETQDVDQVLTSVKNATKISTQKSDPQSSLAAYVTTENVTQSPTSRSRQSTDLLEDPTVPSEATTRSSSLKDSESTSLVTVGALSSTPERDSTTSQELSEISLEIATTPKPSTENSKNTTLYNSSYGQSDHSETSRQISSTNTMYTMSIKNDPETTKNIEQESRTTVSVGEMMSEKQSTSVEVHDATGSTSNVSPQTESTEDFPVNREEQTVMVDTTRGISTTNKPYTTKTKQDTTLSEDVGIFNITPRKKEKHPEHGEVKKKPLRSYAALEIVTIVFGCIGMLLMLAGFAVYCMSRKKKAMPISAPRMMSRMSFNDA